MAFKDLTEELSELGYGATWSQAIEWSVKDHARRAEKDATRRRFETPVQRELRNARRRVEVDKRNRMHQVESRHAKKSTCSHPDRPHKARGLCNTCYMSAWREGVARC